MQNKSTYFWGIFLGIIRSVFSMGVVLFVRYMSLIVINNQENQWFSFTICCILYFIFYTIIYYGSKIVQLQGLKNKRIEFKRRIFHSILYRNYIKYHKETTGDYISQMTNNVDILSSAYYDEIMKITENVVSFNLSIITVCLVNYKIAIGIVIIVLLYYFATKKLNQTLANLQNEYVIKMQQQMTALSENVSGFSQIRSYGAEENFLNRFTSALVKEQTAYYKFSVSFSVISFLNNNIESFLKLIIIISGSFILAKKPEAFMLADILAVTQLITYITKPISTFGNSYIKLKTVKPIHEKLKLEEKTAQQEEKSWVTENNVNIDSTLIELSNVSFSYDNTEVLSNISFKFEQGKRYAIIGKSGEGKSTLIKLILKLIEPQSGVIKMGGVRYSNLTRKDILNQIAVVEQSPFLLQKSTDFNITLGKEGNTKSVKEMFCIHNEKNLSGGEKQRVAIARALFSNKRILVLDEYDSALDEDTAKKIEKNLFENNNKTIIAITHKLNFQKHYLFDKIIQINDGKIII